MYLKEENTYAGLDSPAAGAGHGINRIYVPGNVEGTRLKSKLAQMLWWFAPMVRSDSEFTPCPFTCFLKNTIIKKMKALALERTSVCAFIHPSARFSSTLLNSADSRGSVLQVKTDHRSFPELQPHCCLLRRVLDLGFFHKRRLRIKRDGRCFVLVFLFLKSASMWPRPSKFCDSSWNIACMCRADGVAT